MSSSADRTRTRVPWAAAWRRLRCRPAPESKKVLELTLREALRLGHNYIGTEHILLGVLSQEEGLGARVLVELGITQERVEGWLIPVLDKMVKERGGQK